MRRKEQKSFYRKRKKGRRIEKDHKHYSRRLRQGIGEGSDPCKFPG